jgi:hypothetical protein
MVCRGSGGLLDLVLDLDPKLSGRGPDLDFDLDSNLGPDLDRDLKLLGLDRMFICLELDRDFWDCWDCWDRDRDLDSGPDLEFERDLDLDLDLERELDLDLDLDLDLEPELDLDLDPEESRPEFDPDRSLSLWRTLGDGQREGSASMASNSSSPMDSLKINTGTPLVGRGTPCHSVTQLSLNLQKKRVDIAQRVRVPS